MKMQMKNILKRRTGMQLLLLLQSWLLPILCLRYTFVNLFYAKREFGVHDAVNSHTFDLRIAFGCS